MIKAMRDIFSMSYLRQTFAKIVIGLIVFNNTACAQSSTETVDIAVHKSVNVNFANFISQKTISFRKNGVASEQLDGLFSFLKKKFDQLGLEEVPSNSLSNSITLILSDVGRFSRRMTPHEFPVNRSVDVMLCHDPIKSPIDTSFKCDHIVFEYYQKSSFPEQKFHDFVWQQISTAAPQKINGTRAFSDPEFYTVHN